MTNKKKANYISCIVAILHAFVSTYIAFIGIFYFCDREGANLFNDQECIRNPKNYHQFAAMITISYLVFDFSLQLFLIRDYSTLSIQTYIHHIFGTLGFYLALIENTVSLTAAIFNQATEISTGFLNLRQLFFFHKMKETVYFRINSYIFAATFILGRMPIQLICTYNVFPWIVEKIQSMGKTDVYYNSMILFMVFSQIVGLILNFYWSNLILAGLVRTIKGDNKTKTLDETDKED
ncbi:UNKNOWN [Stylonychia lemnae]|uniref:TLC domain-containing protein n=1 Tax=Stylonychia lemnae TaxID=5949 RepID=A0A078ANP2_STYLE|nr:UNKNOWN [Stylonychia lemnae]|eukprot:CDW83784.1 UNKNOWN [Stylonychia lemnae]